MWLTLLLLVFLVVIVFGFVLEPIVRARRDKVVIDSLNLPDLPPGLVQEDDSFEPHNSDELADPAGAGDPSIDSTTVEHNT